MIRCKKENIEWLEFEQLQEFPEVVHGVFMRHGGESVPPFDSLNLGGGTGDDPKKIEDNRQKICRVLGLDQWVASKQVHKDHVEVVPTQKEKLETGCDGLITNQKNLALLIKHADCQAAIFFDPIQQVVANVHCGWRGNVSNIYEKTVQSLQKNFHCKPENLFVCISPSLGPNAAEFIHYKEELPENFFSYQVRPNYFDFWEISKMQLQKVGVLEYHVEIAKICTYAEGKDFFSYRRERKTGRNGTVVALKTCDHSVKAVSERKT